MFHIVVIALILMVIGWGITMINQMVTDFNMYWNRGIITDDDIKTFILKSTNKHIYDLVYNKSSSGNNKSTQFKLSFKSDINKNKLQIIIEPN